MVVRMASDSSQIYNGIGTTMPHVAVPVSYEDEGVADWIEGEPTAGGLEAVDGNAFPCILFLPTPGAQDTPYRLRTVQTPTMLFNPRRPDNTIVTLSHEDELLITASELAPWTGAETTRWQVDGEPQPFGPPGSVIGLLATVRQVRD